MPTPTPQVLSPYISDVPDGSLSLITSALNAPANWLVVRCILAALQADQPARPFGQNELTRIYIPRRVVLLSFLRPLSLWVEIGKKAGLDISSLLASRRLIYIDGLNIYGASTVLSGAAGPPSTRSHALKDVQHVLEAAIEANYQQSGTKAATAETDRGSQDMPTQPVLIIDGLDFLIASQPDVTAIDVSQMLTTIRQHVHSTMLAVSSDGPLLHGTGISTTPLEQEHQALVAALAHQSRLVMQLRGLDTGTAKDISGVIRISHGGGYEDEPGEQVLTQGEWLYKVSGDGGVRVWGRGE